MKKIGVFPASAISKLHRLFCGLGELFDVEFVDVYDCGDMDGAALLLGVTRKQAVEFAARGMRCLAVVKPDSAPASFSSTSITFGESPFLAPLFRGRELGHRALGMECGLKTEAGDEVLARCGSEALWSRFPMGAASVELVALALPELSADDYLFRHFLPDNWMRLLPILHFLRQISDWQPPPVRACFMFDDPNLHWTSYGYVKFGPLAQHAREHNYHVSFATVPLDGWYVQPQAATLFQENKGQLSLLIHGNNHTLMELARPNSDAGRRKLAAQALHRIEQLEQISNLCVPRIMTAPHGACSPDMAAVLMRTGFEAACVSRGSLMSRNRSMTWPPAIGLGLAEFLGGGFPVIPRFRLAKGCLNNILFAAFLGQPIIPVGHHDDLEDGMDLLRELAELINSITGVQWMNMEAVARSNYCTHGVGPVLHVKMYSRKVRLAVPRGTKQLCIHRPWLQNGSWERLAVRIQRDGLEPAEFEVQQGASIPVEEDMDVNIASVHPGMIDPHSVPFPRTPLHVIARRQLCEVRDRVRPVLRPLLATLKGVSKQRGAG